MCLPLPINKRDKQQGYCLMFSEVFLCSMCRLWGTCVFALVIKHAHGIKKCIQLAKAPRRDP